MKVRSNRFCCSGFSSIVFHIITLQALPVWKFILFTSLPTQATSSLTAGTQTQAKRILEVFGMDTCKFFFFPPDRFILVLNVMHVLNALWQSLHMCIYSLAVIQTTSLSYGFLFSLLISFSSFSCLRNADACWIHDLDPTYFLTLFHWFYLDPALVRNVPWSSLTLIQDWPTSIFANGIVTSSS
jgi:hypothetical protein